MSLLIGHYVKSIIVLFLSRVQGNINDEKMFEFLEEFLSICNLYNIINGLSRKFLAKDIY